jgi:hypothetical protein
MLIFFDNKKQKYIWRIVLVVWGIIFYLSPYFTESGDISSPIGFGLVMWIILGNFILKLFRVGK